MHPKNHFRTFFSFLLLVFVLCSCDVSNSDEGKGENKKTTWELISAHPWKFRKMSMGDQPIPPAVLFESVFNFKPDGTFTIVMGETDLGTWKLSDNEKVLITLDQDGKTEKHIDINFVNDTTLLLINTQNDPPVRMELQPL